jgi:cytochrome c-type biogenesis protein CcmH
MSKTIAGILILVALVLARAAFAGEAAPAAADPALEARVTAVASELRCLVCQNQTLADSNAPLAVDLRDQIREQMKRGASERDIVDYMVARYGDFVRYRPPLKGTTVALWIGPFVLLAAAAGGLAWYIRSRRTRVATAALSPEEEARVARLLGDARDDRPA